MQVVIYVVLLGRHNFRPSVCSVADSSKQHSMPTQEQNLLPARQGIQRPVRWCCNRNQNQQQQRAVCVVMSIEPKGAGLVGKE